MTKEVENNNSIATATAITLGTAATGQLSTASDVDYFKVTANSVGALSVVFDVPTDISYASYFKLGLYDSAGTLLSSFSTGEDKTYSVGVPSVGTYYLGVSAVSTSY
ncbi:hypothetical protein E3V39_15065, partial [Gammaproteobacteria bacterium LSUCC0112]